MPNLEINAKPEVPEGVTRTIRHYGETFQLWDWRFWVELVDELANDGDASVTITHDYWMAHMQIRRSLLDSEYLDLAILHEILHIMLAAQDWGVLAIIDLVTARLRPNARDIWRHGDEQATERLARLLYNLLPKP